MPYSMKPVAVDERIKYFKADSRAPARPARPHRQYSASESSSMPRKIVSKFAAPAISMAPVALHNINATPPPI